MNKFLTRSLQCGKEIIQSIKHHQCRTYVQHHVDIKKSVFISQSRDIFTNLALEDWFYKNYDFTNHHILMFWQNDPCVVVGRHQNPWEEINMNNLLKRNICLARRNSGGGTVYHDPGNLNLTFFTCRYHYDRLYNLKLITKAINDEFGVELNVTPKFNITYKDKKISGTASKLGRNNTYHHCTILLNADKEALDDLMKKKQSYIDSNATKSIPAEIMNLSETSDKITMESLISAIGWEYLKMDPVVLRDDSEHLGDQQGFQLINPTEEWFPGLTQIYNDLRSWEWIYGKTPKFSLKRSFPLLNSNKNDVNVKINVENGLVNGMNLELSGDEIKIVSLEGEKFTNVTNELKITLGENELNDDNKKFVKECVRKIFTEL